MKLRLGVGFATRSSQARRPKTRPADHHVAHCFLLCVQELAEISPPLCLGTGGTEVARLPCPLHLCVRKHRDEARGTTAPHTPWSRVADRSAIDREVREHRGGRRGESPARSESGRTPASPPRVHAVCAPCVRDEARTPHPCPSPPKPSAPDRRLRHRSFRSPSHATDFARTADHAVLPRRCRHPARYRMAHAEREYKAQSHGADTQCHDRRQWASSAGFVRTHRGPDCHGL
jgi:hypothetical protein